MGAEQRKVRAQQASDRDRLTPTILAIFTPVDIIVTVIVIVIVVIVVIIIFIQCCLYSLLFSSPARELILTEGPF